MKVINSKTHAILDYLTVIFLALSPMFFNMEGKLKGFTLTLAVIHLALTILTRFEFGIIKIIPFKIHGIIEIVVAIALTAVAFWFNDQDIVLGFYYYLWLAVIILAVFLLTDFRSGTAHGN